jgi:hypothetical protein
MKDDTSARVLNRRQALTIIAGLTAAVSLTALQPGVSSR